MKEFIIEDFEREHLKDQIYLQQKQKEMEEQWWLEECKRMNNEERRPAIINVVIEKGIPKLIEK